jgi:Tfp pilus assembly protein PilN
MAEMDMIPLDYRQARVLRRLRQHAQWAGLVVLVCLVAARLVLAALTWQEKVQLGRLEPQQQSATREQARTDTLRQQKQVTEQQLAVLDELRGHDHVTQFLRALDASFVAGIWLDRVHFMRPGVSETLAHMPGGTHSGIVVVPGTATRTQDIHQGAEVVGYARSHTQLADFMRQLGTQSRVADLRLIATGTRNYTSMQVVDFTLALQVHKRPAGPF